MVVRVILDYLLFVMHLQHSCQILTEVLRDKHYILLTDEDTKAQEVMSRIQTWICLSKNMLLIILIYSCPVFKFKKLT